MKDTFAPSVYMLASGRNGTLYTGVTSNLIHRVAQHRSDHFDGFSTRYGTKLLVWFEMHATMEHAIKREKRIKKWNRGWKLRLIEEGNPQWRDLATDLGFEAMR
ncbi:GIY-YIG nuclease family protein [Novosphingobium decolorationis]|uniref:GIY-YIG nuclease family protein n=1 Tax=Novosphingobium decolorationis TaxID=2698673 RepID=A0ABX8E4V5_9SPHN|nr:GIY-YIG nuclease family protein [Novosphingobium decolorationis]QVM83231.1 GIY-YIG nuclease family protein [Novosphingobium decolorationis]